MPLQLVPPSGEGRAPEPYLHQVISFGVLQHFVAHAGHFCVDVLRLVTCPCSGIDAKVKSAPIAILTGQALAVWDLGLDDWLPGRIGFDTQLGAYFVGFYWQPSVLVNAPPRPRFMVPLDELARRGVMVQLTVMT